MWFMTRDIDWKELGFAYRETNAYVKTEFRDGEWQPLTVCTEPYINLHVAATCVHYGQSCFEGLKAFTQKSGQVAMFRPTENAQRMVDTARRLIMVPPPVELFVEACTLAVQINRDFVPPFGTGASLYLRPLLIGTSPHIGIHESEEYTFLVLVTPVGPYYKDGFFPVRALVQERYDRAAPRGVGNVKVAGNYAAGLACDKDTKSRGYTIPLYLDSATRQYVDEFGTSNFFGITADGRYVTPDSASILPSITNKSLQVIVEDFGMKVERRAVKVAELDQFSEVGACGTAAVITPVASVTWLEKEFTFGDPREAGATLKRLYKQIQGIQYGEIEDTHGWMTTVK
jgi:branched-chain amino acid aminotransferase